MNTVPSSPYKGLAPFDDSDLDSLLFFGRERDVQIVVANLIASRLTVLYGPSGVGKSSLLQAGVARSLRELPEGPLVVVFSRWADEPVAALAQEIASDAGVEQASLLETLRSVEAAGRDIYLVLDQTEEYFLYHLDVSAFERSLAALLAVPLRVNVLLSLREDTLAKLDRFKGPIPNILSNYLRLDRLDRSAGEAAILQPLERFRELGGDAVVIEPALVEAVLAQVAAGRIRDGLGGEGGIDGGVEGVRIEAPYLQLVMERIWEVERATGSSRLRLVTLDGLGGATAIVADHLDRAMSVLDDQQREIASRLFAHLVTPSGTKIALPLADLAKIAAVPETEVQPVLDLLAERRILRPGDGGGYEIFHDVLAGAVLGWRERHELEQAVASGRRHRRRAIGVAISAFVIVLLMAGITTFALIQRHHARAQTTIAEARALDASATSQLTVDPQLSVALAAQAAQRSPTVQAYEVLQDALLLDHLRGQVSTRGPVTAIAYAPPGNRMVVGSEDGSARIVDARSHAVLSELRHDGPVRAASFSADGRLLVTGSADRTSRIWDVETGKQRAVLPHGGPVVSASFAPDGRIVVAGGHSVALWRMGGSKPIRIFRQAVPATRGLLSPDGRLLVVLGTDRRIRVFDARSGSSHPALDEGATPTDAMFRADGRLAVADQGGLVTIWDPARGKATTVLRGHRGRVLDVEWSPDGTQLVTAGVDGTARTWDARTGEPLGRLGGGTNYVESASFSTDGRSVVTAGRYGSGQTWVVEDGRQAALLLGSPAPLTDAAYRPDGREVVTAGDDGIARFWDSRTAPELVPTSAPAPSKPRLTAQSPDGGMTARASGDDVIVSSVGKRLRLTGHSDVVNSVAFSPDGSMLVTASHDHDARLWDVRSGRLLHVLDGHFGSVADARFSPDGRWVVTAGPSSAGLWRVSDGHLLQYLRGPNHLLNAAAFRASTIVTSETDGTVRSFDCEICGATPALLEIAARRLQATHRVLTDEERRLYVG